MQTTRRFRLPFSKTHRQLISNPNYVLKPDLETLLTQLYIYNKSPNLFNQCDHLNQVRSGYKNLSQYAELWTQPRHQILDLDLDNQMELEWLDFENTKSAQSKQQIIQRSQTLNLNWPFGWLFEKPYLNSVCWWCRVFDFLNAKDLWLKWI